MSKMHQGLNFCVLYSHHHYFFDTSRKIEDAPIIDLLNAFNELNQSVIKMMGFFLINNQ